MTDSVEYYDERLRVIHDRMIEAGIDAGEVSRLMKPLKDEFERRVCGLVWSHKTATQKMIQDMGQRLPLLTPSPAESIVQDENGRDHVLVEGDNLYLLMAMQYTHVRGGRGMVDVIYIDPPYNTKNVTFAYNDRFEKSEWLSMMDVRLRLARNVMTDNGLIFISIDAGYQAELKLLCYDIFGGNLLGMISVVNNRKGRSDDKYFATANEFLYVYTKGIKPPVIKGFPMTSSQSSEYKYLDNISRYKLVGLKKTGKNCYREDRPNMFYPIYYDKVTGSLSLTPSSDSIELLPSIKGRDGCWRWGKDKFEANKNSELVVRKTRNGYTVYVKMRDLVDGEPRTVRPKTVWIDPKYDSAKGTELIEKIFGDKSAFENPKPLEYIKDILRISTMKTAIVLDFFAGSGTTMQAVLELNAEDGGHRQCILGTNNELGKDAVRKAEENGCVEGSPEWESFGVCQAVTLKRMQYVFPSHEHDNLRFYRISESKMVNDSIADDITRMQMARHAVPYISLREEAYADDAHDDESYHMLTSPTKHVMVVTDINMLTTDIEALAEARGVDGLVVYCPIRKSYNKGNISYREYPREIIDALRHSQVRARQVTQ